MPDLGPNTTIAALAEDAAHCTRCHLYKYATQTVFGEGPSDARIVMVGEQPGDQEDLQGKSFVGPAGRLLDRALEEAKIDRDEVYVTNAVKHFKFERRGKKRIHKKPDRPEIEACKWWLERELAVVGPELVVALGGTAGQALYGRAVKVLSERGRLSDDPRFPADAHRPPLDDPARSRRGGEEEGVRRFPARSAARSLIRQANRLRFWRRHRRRV